jgi:hypothetical protein
MQVHLYKRPRSLSSPPIAPRAPQPVLLCMRHFLVVYSCGSHFGQHKPASRPLAWPKFRASRGMRNVPSPFFPNFQAEFVGAEAQNVSRHSSPTLVDQSTPRSTHVLRRAPPEIDPPPTPSFMAPQPHVSRQRADLPPPPPPISSGCAAVPGSGCLGKLSSSTTDLVALARSCGARHISLLACAPTTGAFRGAGVFAGSSGLHSLNPAAITPFHGGIGSQPP